MCNSFRVLGDLKVSRFQVPSTPEHPSMPELLLLIQKMRYVAAYLLATLGGNSNPSKEDIVTILSSVGLDVEDDKLQKVSSCE